MRREKTNTQSKGDKQPVLSCYTQFGIERSGWEEGKDRSDWSVPSLFYWALFGAGGGSQGVLAT